MTTELCPTFLMDGETIVDVFYAPMKEVEEGTWQSDGSTELKPTGFIDRAVLETPVGCFEFRHPMRPGDTLRLVEGGAGNLWTRCQRSSSQTADVLVEATL